MRNGETLRRLVSDIVDNCLDAESNGDLLSVESSRLKKDVYQLLIKRGVVVMKQAQETATGLVTLPVADDKFELAFYYEGEQEPVTVLVPKYILRKLHRDYIEYANDT